MHAGKNEGMGYEFKKTLNNNKERRNEMLLIAGFGKEKKKILRYPSKYQQRFVLPSHID